MKYKGRNVPCIGGRVVRPRADFHPLTPPCSIHSHRTVNWIRKTDHATNGRLNGGEINLKLQFSQSSKEATCAPCAGVKTTATSTLPEEEKTETVLWWILGSIKLECYHQSVTLSSSTIYAGCTILDMKICCKWLSYHTENWAVQQYKNSWLESSLAGSVDWTRHEVTK